MRQYLVILKYELFALFISPATYVATFYFLALLGVGFRFFIESFSYTDWILPPLSSLVVGLLFGAPALIPFITMRCFAEERRLGTLETLVSAPINISLLVAGKWSACFLFFICISMLCFCYPLLLFFIFPEQGYNLGFNNIAHWIGSGIYLFIFGATFTAIGVFSSSITKNQMVAGMLTFTLLTLYIALMTFSFGDSTSTEYSSKPEKLIAALFGSFNKGLIKLEQFSVGLIDISTILHQISLTIFFLILSAIQIERLNK
ncbi:MAG: ABC transporter permease subunit [Opitutales bacterium]|jgi:ABC-2 type transport system permease protein|tara:strand:- start:3623 stop:4402 length:780 start_codon:yes stop_codon:yes gene_type:complete